MTVVKLSSKAHDELGQCCNETTTPGCSLMGKEQQDSTFASRPSAVCITERVVCGMLPTARR